MGGICVQVGTCQEGRPRSNCQLSAGPVGGEGVCWSCRGPAPLLLQGMLGNQRGYAQGHSWGVHGGLLEGEEFQPGLKIMGTSKIANVSIAGQGRVGGELSFPYVQATLQDKSESLHPRLGRLHAFNFLIQYLF